MRSLSLSVAPRDGLSALGVGVLSAASFPPLGIWPFALLAPVLLLLLIRDRNPVEARNLGLLYGFVYGAGTIYWFFWIFSVLAVPLIALFAAYFGLLATLIGMTKGRSPLVRAALTALFAVAVEWLRGDAWYLRFPWYTVPHALAAEPTWIAPVRWLGVYGLSYHIWLIAAAGAFGRAFAWLGFLLLPISSLLLAPVEPPDQRALLVQFEERWPDGILSHLPDKKVDLIVLPEYAYRCPPRTALGFPKGPTILVRNLSCPLVFGAVEGSYIQGNFENVAVVLDAEGNIVDTFPKQRPVPLFNDGHPGTRQPVFPLDEGTLGVAVCYDFDAPEIAASLVRQGATVLAAPTYDAMWWGRVQHVHHEMLLRLRAVENDRWILRAASSGRSEAINPQGVPSQEGVEIGKDGCVVVAYSHRSTYSLGGQAYVLGPMAAGVTVLFLVWQSVQFFQKRRKEPAEVASSQ